MPEITAEQIEQIARETVEAAVKKQIDDVRQDTSNFLKGLFQAERESRDKLETAEAGIRAARFIKCIAAAKLDPDNRSPAQMAEALYAEDTVLHAGFERSKSLTTQLATEGGTLVPPEFSSEIIELLRPQTVVRRFIPSTLPMASGTLTIPRQTAASSFGYLGEAQAQNASQPSTGDITLTWKKGRTTVPASNELIMMSNPSADAFIRNDIVRVMALGEDQAFLRNAGTQYSPKGLRSWAPAANVLNANTTVNLTNVTDDLRDLINQLRGQNVPFVRPVWIMGPRALGYLQTVRDGNGNFAFPETRSGSGTGPDAGQLWQWPIAWTNSIPENLGGGVDSEVYLVDFSEVILGESSGLEITASREATYTDSTGSLVSAFDRDETVIKAIARHDLAMRHVESVGYLDTVRWGT